ncbi:MAG: PA2169 family four-helix-bundle protein [Steroidobacteraceae bacterium]|nr:PA2169 family four-helix-bundle protein [Steroidobacteraceae bacterium]
MATIHDESHDVDVLNALIETTLDSINGYEEAAKDASDTRFESIFRERAAERREVALRLQEEVRRLGGDPEDEGSVLAAAHRQFLGIRNAFGKGDQAVVDEVERGEDVIKERFEKALRDDRISAPTREVVAKFYESVRRGHDQARAMKHSGVAAQP